MLKNARNHTTDGLSYDGCSCHNTKAQKRPSKKAAKKREQKAWRSEAGLR
ncbi:hypothetical protein [Agromyces humi]|nr:hypothetical protein [Agromyces humi]